MEKFGTVERVSVQKSAGYQKSPIDARELFKKFRSLLSDLEDFKGSAQSIVDTLEKVPLSSLNDLDGRNNQAAYKILDTVIEKAKEIEADLKLSISSSHWLKA